MAPGVVTRSPAFSSFTEIKCSIEICPLDPMRVIPSVVTSILMVDKIGIAFLELIALLVVFKACKK